MAPQEDGQMLSPKSNYRYGMGKLTNMTICVLQKSTKTIQPSEESLLLTNLFNYGQEEEKSVAFWHEPAPKWEWPWGLVASLLWLKELMRFRAVGDGHTPQPCCSNWLSKIWSQGAGQRIHLPEVTWPRQHILGWGCAQVQRSLGRAQASHTLLVATHICTDVKVCSRK